MRIWLTFDLGLRGDYESLYRWLDDNDAKECGEGAASLSTNKSSEVIEEELQATLAPQSRVYLICRKQDKYAGKFIMGKRKPAPWIGFGFKGVGEETEDTE